MSKPLRIAIVALAITAGLLFPNAAHAEKWSSGDSDGDVTGLHFDPEPAPCGTYTDVDGTTDTNDDITRLVVGHMRREIKLRAQFSDLDPTLEQEVTFHLATEVRGWFLHVSRFRNPSTGHFRMMAFLIKEPNYPDPEDIEDECGGFSFVGFGLDCPLHPQVDLDADIIRATVTRSCLRNPRWVRVGAVASSWMPAEDPEDESYDAFSDEWGTRDEETSPWLPEFGPKVPKPPHAPGGGPAMEPAESKRFVVSPRLR